MKRWRTFFLFCAVTLWLAAGEESSVVGSYHSAGGTQVITLALLPNGNYLARWDVDIFPEYGRASGSWTFEDGEVRLNPKKEEDALKGHLTALLPRKMEGRRALIRKEDIQHAENPFFYFYAPEEPNQASQRNAGSRPVSNDSPASATPSAPAPRG